MFVLENSLQFVNVDVNYLKKLHEVCPEVYYKSTGYENKPFLGILISHDNKKYVLPLSSAKSKHKFWNDTEKIIPFCCDFKLLEKTCDEY